MGMRRGLRTVRRNTAKTSIDSTPTLAHSMTTLRARAAVSPRISARENEGKSPWMSNSVVPTVMTRKPQKMITW